MNETFVGGVRPMSIVPEFVQIFFVASGVHRDVDSKRSGFVEPTSVSLISRLSAVNFRDRLSWLVRRRGR
jgi:hypothetical protein